MKSMMFAAALVVLVATPSRAEDRLQPGLWEMTTTHRGSYTSAVRCVGATEALGANGSEAEIAAAITALIGDACRVESVTAEGKRVRYALACGNGPSTFDAVYAGTSYEGTMMTLVGGSTRPEPVRITGRRKGDCPG